MDSIRSMANYGVHGGTVKVRDALYILDLIYEITDWYMDNYKVESVFVPAKLQETIMVPPKTENSTHSLKQFWQEEEATMEAEYKSEQDELNKKHNMEEIAMRMFVGDPKADEMMKELTSDIEAMAGRMASRVEAFIPNVQNKIKNELNKK